MVSVGSGGEILDSGGQGLDILDLSLVGSGEDGDLRLEVSNFIYQGSETSRHCPLYLGQGVFEAVVAVVRGVRYRWG